jgi:hypothetical protein
VGIDELTAELLATVLDAPVVGVSHERVGTGLVGMNVRCRLTFSEEPPAGTPASVVAKLPSPDETSRATGVALRNYEREVRFYTEIAPTVGITTPTCHHAAWDAGTGDFVLILEDLAPAEQGDQIHGCTVDHARLAVTELAGLHAPRWGDPALADVEWLSRRDVGDAERVQGMYLAVLDGWCARFGPRLSGEQLDLARRFGEQIVAWLDLRTPPFTVTHGDYRLENMMFGTPAGGHPLAVVDWQTPGHGPGTADLAYFLGAGLHVEDRRLHEQELVGAYHHALVEQGVDGVEPSTLWEHYRLESFAGVVMTVVASMIVGRTERSDDMFTAMAERHLQHALDLDAWSLVD